MTEFKCPVCGKELGYTQKRDARAYCSGDDIDIEEGITHIWTCKNCGARAEVFKSFSYYDWLEDKAKSIRKGEIEPTDEEIEEVFNNTMYLFKKYAIEQLKRGRE